MAAESLNVTLTGSSSEVLRRLAEDAVRTLSAVEGLSGVVSEAGAGDQEVQLRVDRERANQLGFSTQEVAQAVAIAHSWRRSAGVQGRGGRNPGAPAIARGRP